jgi:hypothetical protein
MRGGRRVGKRARLAISFATAAIIGPLVRLWRGSPLPGTYSVVDTGVEEFVPR